MGVIIVGISVGMTGQCFLNHDKAWTPAVT